MAVPRRRHSKSRRDKARTHKKLAARQTILCPNPECAKPKLPHRVCPHCGRYQGREYRTIVTTG